MASNSLAFLDTNRRVWLREALLVSGLVAAFLTLLFAVDHANPSGIDRHLARAIQAIRWGELAFLPRLASDMGGGVYGFYVVPALMGAWFAATRRWRMLVLLVAVFALHYVLIAPKQLVLAYRPSPLFGVEGAGGLESFPSGHVEWAASFYGLLAYLAWRAVPAPWRRAVI
jgi:membrane-associated phospholipid phosphatase